LQIEIQKNRLLFLCFLYYVVEHMEFYPIYLKSNLISWRTESNQKAENLFREEHGHA
jgi:hypothetical protein